MLIVDSDVGMMSQPCVVIHPFCFQSDLESTGKCAFHSCLSRSDFIGSHWKAIKFEGNASLCTILPLSAIKKDGNSRWCTRFCVECAIECACSLRKVQGKVTRYMHRLGRHGPKVIPWRSHFQRYKRPFVTQKMRPSWDNFRTRSPRGMNFTLLVAPSGVTGTTSGVTIIEGASGIPMGQYFGLSAPPWSRVQLPVEAQNDLLISDFSPSIIY